MMDYQLEEVYETLEEYFLDTFFHSGIWINGNIVNSRLINPHSSDNDNSEFFIDSFGNVVFYQNTYLSNDNKIHIQNIMNVNYKDDFIAFFDRLNFRNTLILNNSSDMSFIRFDENSSFFDVVFAYFIFLYLSEKGKLLFIGNESYENISDYFIKYFYLNRNNIGRQFNLKLPVIDSTTDVSKMPFHEALIDHIDC